MKKLISLILSVVLICSGMVFAGAENDKTLRFNKDGTFRILHITDPQDDQNLSYDMLNLIKLSIEQSKPDMIVFTGDMVEDSRKADPGVDDDGTREGVCVYGSDGKLDYDTTLSNIKTTTDAVLSIINDAKIPFAIAQGNNDHGVGITNETWLELYSKYEYCLTNDESPDSDGRIDYNLEIKASDSDRTAFNLWLMDTGTKGVTQEQIDWYKSESTVLTKANGGTPVPSFEFQHIYVDDIGNLFQRCAIWKEGAMFKGIGVFRLNKNIAHGYNTAVYKPLRKPTAQFKAWKEQGDVIGAYFGHEHYEGFTGTYDGIEMGLTYGCEFSKEGPYGYRVITLHEDDIKNFENELYLYTGSVKTGDAAVSLQIDEPYYEFRNFGERFKAFFKNIVATFKTI